MNLEFRIEDYGINLPNHDVVHAAIHQLNYNKAADTNGLPVKPLKAGGEKQYTVSWSFYYSPDIPTASNPGNLGIKNWHPPSLHRLKGTAIRDCV